MQELTNTLIEIIDQMPLDEKVNAINEVKIALHQISPFKNEPVDCVLWAKKDSVVANDYNPNKVAPPEMELLELSIMHDGYTQPIVAWEKNAQTLEVVDGFHRSRVGKESDAILSRVLGYLPVVKIRSEQQGKNDRVASTIRHNRARGKHQIDAMSEIVCELKNRNWTNARIARELGMDEDEVLRLCQITGLEHLFSDKDFSMAWEAEDSEEDFEPISDELADEDMNVRTANTNDPTRIFHTYDKWECHKAGFYASRKEGMTADQCIASFAEFFKFPLEYKSAMDAIIRQWPHSCEHYLTNKAMNRIAWIGQAAACYSRGIPSVFCSGWSLLSEQQQTEANLYALKVLNQWLTENGLENVTFEEAVSTGRQVEIY